LSDSLEGLAASAAGVVAAAPIAANKPTLIKSRRSMVLSCLGLKFYQIYVLKLSQNQWFGVNEAKR
jgi:hypothetical protein